jgi:hypothetical protein
MNYASHEFISRYEIPLNISEVDVLARIFILDIKLTKWIN